MDYIIDFNAIDLNFLQELKSKFANKKVKISVNEIIETEEKSQKQLWEEMERCNKKYPTRIIPEGFDIAQIANEVNL